MSSLREYIVPGLATVTIDTLDDGEPTVKIVLDPAYRGDLNDLAAANPYPEGVYLQCDSTSCINDPALARFMEVLSHWDYDHDGLFDADVLARDIEESLWRSTETPAVFHRPSEGLYTGTLMRLMPPPPDRHIIYSFDELKKRFRLWHYFIGLPLIAVILGLVQLQIHYLPFMKYSVISGMFAVGSWFGLKEWMTLVIFIVLTAVVRNVFDKKGDNPLSISKHTYGFFNKFAVYEEQGFREGAENWTFGQRVTSCLVFGAVHMTNLIYPLATILPLALGGAVFMAVYLRVYRRTRFRRSAVLTAALVHRVYNRLALTAIVIALSLSFGWWVVGLFGVMALVLWIDAALGERKFQQVVQPERSTVSR